MEEGLTKESQMTHLPSHFSQSRPRAMPGCLRHITRSGWCFAMVFGRVVGGGGGGGLMSRGWGGVL